jgi:DMSO/TMAO reductase YedYZ molybdopterin-dependent catalytic subunit
MICGTSARRVSDMAKYIMRLELVESFARFGEGHGGYWEDQGYEWYAGI